MLAVGSMAPDFTAQNHRGMRTSLADLKGKTTILWFFPKADTPG